LGVAHQSFVGHQQTLAKKGEDFMQNAAKTCPGNREEYTEIQTGEKRSLVKKKQNYEQGRLPD